jgi:hypothetical protein
MGRMATVLVLEPLAEVRELFAFQLARIGHQPVYDRTTAYDALLVEPADPLMLRRAVELRKTRPELPVVCASIEDNPRVADPLRPCTYLVKPFGVERLRRALDAELKTAE